MSKFRAGIFNNPKNDDLEFNHQHQAEEWCQQQLKICDKSAYAVWDNNDKTVYLLFDYEEFEPRNQL
jgi:hypothetical protein